MGSGQVGRGGGRNGGPDNNVTIRPAPRTNRAVKESESKQWSVTDGVSGSRGEEGIGVCRDGWGASGSQGLAASYCWVVAEICVCMGVCMHTGWRQRDEKVTG